ncbi:MAG: TlpA disulfide reductase family protein [Deferrisomatales bacterium]|nr:TlpA disulfide reductase family protein [Deferrisomatales bacterium]
MSLTHRNRSLRGAAVLLFAGVLLVWLAPAAPAAEMFRLREPGEPLPSMTLNDMDGVPHTLDPASVGRPVLLFFWSVYCPNCKEAMPALVELSAGAVGEQVEVWAINVDGERFSNAVKVYVRDMQLPFPCVYDRLEGEYLVAADPLGVSKTPTLYLAGRDGKILLRQVVGIDTGAVATALRAAATP